MPDDGPENVIHIKPRAKRKGFKITLLELARRFRREPELAQGKMFAADLFSREEVLMTRINRPDTEPTGAFKPRSVTPTDITHLMEWFEANGAIGKVSREVVEQAVAAEAERNSYSSAVVELNALPVWDGVHRLENFWIKVCGADPAECDEDGVTQLTDEEIHARDRYLRATAKCFFCSVIARIMEPGCKVDTMPILEGPQGSLKSSLLRVLAMKEEWFSDSLGSDVSTKDAKQHLMGKLIIEMAELSQLHGSKAETLKNFLTITHDRYRPPYGRREMVWQRQCVFVGTTNDASYLVDITGNRRFWPIKCGEINLSEARAQVRQLYAEALHVYREAKRGGQRAWVLPAEIEVIAAGVQRARLREDPWEDYGQDALDEAINLARAHDEPWAWVTTSKVMEKAGVDPQHRDQAKMQRAGRVLAKLGGTHRTLPRGQGWPKRGFRFDLPKPRYGR